MANKGGMMKIFIIIFGMLMFCNVIGIGIILHSNEAGILNYLNLLGSVGFGYYCCDVINS